MSLFDELKRRNVFRVGIAYVVTAWLVSQVAELAVDSFEAPAWVMKMFITFLALGFPFALIFAWAFELTPEGIKKEKDVDRDRSVTHTTGRKLNYATTAILAVALIYFAWDKFISPQDQVHDVIPAKANVIPAKAGTHSEAIEAAAVDAGKGIPNQTAAANTPAKKSIAVLPFTDRSAGEENTRFLSDGIHDDLLTNLSKLHELKVISRTSVMTYRDTTKNMRQIGEELGVDNLLEGGVQQAGDRVRINVQLIDAHTDEHLWAESYDREISTENIFEIQGEIARSIAGALQATLSPDEYETLGKAPTENLEAYQAILMSRQLEQRGGFEALTAAIEHAQHAIELDPDYADAHLALAFALSSAINTGAMTDAQAGERISTAIDTAMSLQPDYGPAWSILGDYQSNIGNPEAENSFETAMRLDPGNTQTMYSYGFMLQRTGRPARALPLLLQAIELDPLSINLLFALGRTYSGLEKYDKARDSYVRIRALDPSSPLGYAPTAGTYFPQGQIDQGIYWLRLSQTIDPQDFELGGWLVFLYDCLDDPITARQWSDWLDGWITNQPMPMAMQAHNRYLNGEFEAALQLSNLALKLDLPNRWGSDAIFIRIKRDEALAAGDPESGIAIIIAHHPELAGPVPGIAPDNINQAVDLAHLMKLAGKTEESSALLQAVIEYYDRPYSFSPTVGSWLVPVKAEALALLGDGPAALAELRRIIDYGWRVFWRWETELNANFDGIRETAEFRAMVAEMEADMAEQRARVQAMMNSGDIAAPPEVE